MPNSRPRIRIAVCLLLTIVVGIASRKLVSPIPYWLKESGDVLWAVAAYFALATVFPAWPWRRIAVIGLTLAFASELSQLIRTPGLDQLRRNPFLRMLLGSGFSWVDMAMYVLGTAAAVAVDRVLQRPIAPSPQESAKSI